MKLINKQDVIDVCEGNLDRSFKSVCIAVVYFHLKKENWNRTKAAKSLGLSVRCVRNYVTSLRDIGFKVPE